MPANLPAMFANLPPIPEHYLALLSSISFLVILSKCYILLN